jgi:hypothetical protein
MTTSPEGSDPGLVVDNYSSPATPSALETLRSGDASCQPGPDGVDGLRATHSVIMRLVLAPDAVAVTVELG